MIQSAIWNFGPLLHTTWLIVVIDQKSVVKSLESTREVRAHRWTKSLQKMYMIYIYN